MITIWKWFCMQKGNVKIRDFFSAKFQKYNIVVNIVTDYLLLEKVKGNRKCAKCGPSFALADSSGAWRYHICENAITIKRHYRYATKANCSVARLCPTPCDPMDCSTPGFPVLHYLPEFAETHVHWVGDAIQPCEWSTCSNSAPCHYLCLVSFCIQFSTFSQAINTSLSLPVFSYLLCRKQPSTDSSTIREGQDNGSEDSRWGAFLLYAKLSICLSVFMVCTALVFISNGAIWFSSHGWWSSVRVFSYYFSS